MLFIDQNQLVRMSDGSKWKMLGKVSFDSFYLTGGMLLEFETIGLRRLDVFSVTGNEQGFLFEYDYVNQKLKVFSGAGNGTTSSDSGGTPTGTNASVSAGTPTGVVSAPLFTGNVLPDHQHASQVSLFTKVPILEQRLFIDLLTLIGNFQVGDTVTGGTSGNTAVISSIVPNMPNPDLEYFVVTGFTGNFLNGEVLTGSISGATANTLFTLLDAFDVSSFFQPLTGIVTQISTNTQVALLGGFIDLAISPNGYRFNTFQGVVETLHSDGWIELSVQGLNGPTTMVSAGTPSGTNSTPIFTGDPLPAHTHIFAGDPLPPHDHTFSGSGGASEIVMGTDLSFLTNVEFEAIGV